MIGPDAMFRLVVVLGTIVAAAASLSVHVFMLEGLHVPFPYDLPRTGPATWPAWPLLAFGGIWIHLLLAGTRPGWSLPFRICVVFLLIAGLKEDLVRAWLMNLINGDPPTIYPILRFGIPPWILLTCASIGCGVAVAVMGPRSTGFASAAIASCAVGLGVIAASIALDATWGRLLVRLSDLDTPSRWNPPYDWHIMVPAYVTAIEPASAGVALGLLTWDALPTRRGPRMLLLVLLIALVKGHIVEPFINIGYSHASAAVAMLSVGQFTFESLALAFFCAATLEIAKSRTGSRRERRVIRSAGVSPAD